MPTTAGCLRLVGGAAEDGAHTGTRDWRPRLAIRVRLQLGDEARLKTVKPPEVDREAPGGWPRADGH